MRPYCQVQGSSGSSPLPHQLVHTRAAPRLPLPHTNVTTTVQKLHVSPWFNLHPTRHGGRQIRSARLCPTHERVVRHPPTSHQEADGVLSMGRRTQSQNFNAQPNFCIKTTRELLIRTTDAHSRRFNYVTLQKI